jgi:hypothetical protein
MAKNPADQVHASLINANRALIRAMRRRDKLAKQLDAEETSCAKLSQDVKNIIAYLQPHLPPAVPICSDCQHVLGSNKACAFCQDALAIATGEPRLVSEGDE